MSSSGGGEAAPLQGAGAGAAPPRLWDEFDDALANMTDAGPHGGGGGGAWVPSVAGGSAPDVAVGGLCAAPPGGQQEGAARHGALRCLESEHPPGCDRCVCAARGARAQGAAAARARTPSCPLQAARLAGKPRAGALSARRRRRRCTPPPSREDEAGARRCAARRLATQRRARGWARVPIWRAASRPVPPA
jgi:hypothetical protein